MSGPLDTNGAMDSRPAEVSLFGKNDERLDTTLPSDVKRDFAAVAATLGYGSTSELNRRLIEDFLYGSMVRMRMSLTLNRVDGRNSR